MRRTSLLAHHGSASSKQISMHPAPILPRLTNDLGVRYQASICMLCPVVSPYLCRPALCKAELGTSFLGLFSAHFYHQVGRLLVR
jgi:hypothetical protein